VNNQIARNQLKVSAVSSKMPILHRIDRYESASRQTAIVGDLLICGLFTLLLVASLLVPLPALLDILVGLLFMLYIPGYLLLVALFPAHDDLLPVQRQALTIIVNIAMTPMVVYILHRMNPNLDLSIWKQTTAVIVLFLIALATWRRGRLPVWKLYHPTLLSNIRVRIDKWMERKRGRRKALSTWGLATIVATVLFLGSVGYAVAVAEWSDYTTEFYMISVPSPYGPAEYPALPIATGMAIELWVVNHEGRTVDYTLSQQVGEAAPMLVAEITLAAGEAKRINQHVALTPPAAGESNPVKVSYQLFMNSPVDGSLMGQLRWLFGDRMHDSYRVLELWR
jgi:uncharacterized membrane protein